MATVTGSMLFALWVCAVLLQSVVTTLLIALNLNHAKRQNNRPPRIPGTELDTEKFNRSIDYTCAKARFGMITELYETALVLIAVGCGFLGYLNTRLEALIGPGILEGTVYLVALSAGSSALMLPFSWYQTFRIEERFGFNRTRMSLWIVDRIKSGLVSLALMSLLLPVIQRIIGGGGEQWWLYVFAFIGGFFLLMVFFAPVLIAPLFNRFEPVPEGAVKEAVTALTRRLNFKNSGVFLMDGSRRSAHSNAYFTGFGRFRRIVLFDTLLKALSVEQLMAVLAHEIGHQKKGHVVRHIALSLVSLFVMLWLFAKAVHWEPLYAAFGLPEATHTALVAFTLLISPAGFFLTPMMTWLSRRFEFQADRYAVNAVGGAEDLCDALITLSRENLSHLVPHPLYSFFFHSHPTLLERIHQMKGVSNPATPNLV